MALLSVIVPAYNEELMIEKTGMVISDLLSQADIDNEIIFVDDGSKDATVWCMKSFTADRFSSIASTVICCTVHPPFAKLRKSISQKVVFVLV